MNRRRILGQRLINSLSGWLRLHHTLVSTKLKPGFPRLVASRTFICLTRARMSGTPFIVADEPSIERQTENMNPPALFESDRTPHVTRSDIGIDISVETIVFFQARPLLAPTKFTGGCTVIQFQS